MARAELPEVAANGNATGEGDLSFIYFARNGGKVFTNQNVQSMCQLEKLMVDFGKSWKLIYGSLNTCTQEIVRCRLQRVSRLGQVIKTLTYNRKNGLTLLLQGYSLGFSAAGYFYRRSLGLGWNFESCPLLNASMVQVAEAALYANYQFGGSLRQFAGFFLNHPTAATATRSILTLTNVNTNALKVDVESMRKALMEKLNMKPGFLSSVYRSEASFGDIDVVFSYPTLMQDEFSNLITTGRAALLTFIDLIA